MFLLTTIPSSCCKKEQVSKAEIFNAPGNGESTCQGIITLHSPQLNYAAKTGNNPWESFETATNL